MGRILPLTIALAIVVVALAASPLARAYDPDKLQDFCVAIKDSDASVFVNGKICKDINHVNADDFYLQARFNIPRNTSNLFGYVRTPIGAGTLPGLNTMGISIGRVDLGPYGVNTPHIHPLATEVVTVLEGRIYIGFIDSRNRLYAKTLLPGDIIVLPKGLIHFLYNTEDRNAVVYAAFGSQNPEALHLPNAIFGSDPPIPLEILSKAFLLDKNEISRIQSQIRSELSK
ncbi:unnamed protein product [Cuscuta epithymum]|uniref:Germin-like protein n=1 Tax=Cuscuta epithymum TaxID=186058 RepID=A0AAV0GBP8_9ASTE|nr:unnamed protein product [Cuscuta epithymum]